MPGKLLAIQTVEKCAPSIGFIQRALEPYRDRLPFIPSTSPQKVVVQLEVDQTAPPTIRSLKVSDRNLLEKDLEGNGADGRLWRLSFKAISAAELEAELADAWAVPKSLLSVQVGPTAEPGMQFRVPEGFIYPVHARIRKSLGEMTRKLSDTASQ